VHSAASAPALSSLTWLHLVHITDDSKAGEVYNIGGDFHTIEECADWCGATGKQKQRKKLVKVTAMKC
jgi:hypothetical protein